MIYYSEYYTAYPKTTNVRNVIIEGAPHEHKMAGKGQITSERGRKRTRTSQRAPQWHFRSCMRARIFSSGSPTGDVWSDIAQLTVVLARTSPFQGNPFEVTWRLMTSLPVKRPPLGCILCNFRLLMRAPFQANCLRDHVTSHPVAMSGHAQWYMLYYYSKKKLGNRLRMSRAYFRSRLVTWLKSFPVRPLPVAPPNLLLEPCWYTTNVNTWVVL